MNAFTGRPDCPLPRLFAKLFTLAYPGVNFSAYFVDDVADLGVALPVPAREERADGRLLIEEVVTESSGAGTMLSKKL